MKIQRLLLILLCLTVVCGTASAAGAMHAELAGGTLTVIWPVCAGSCTLTVYQNGWPVLSQSVNGNAGEARFNLGNVPGIITVRLRTDNGMLACDTRNDVRTPASTAAPTKAPGKTAMPTVKPASQPESGVSRPSLAAQVIAQVNEERQKQGLGILRESGELNRAAAVRAREIARSFSHTRPDGRSWSTVSGSAYGENIARGQQTADKVMAAWMSSSDHRANIMKASFGSIGVCAYIEGGITYWVQLFGR